MDTKGKKTTNVEVLEFHAVLALWWSNSWFSSVGEQNDTDRPQGECFIAQRLLFETEFCLRGSSIFKKWTQKKAYLVLSFKVWDIIEIFFQEKHPKSMRVQMKNLSLFTHHVQNIRVWLIFETQMKMFSSSVWSSESCEEIRSLYCPVDIWN